ncbi:MAG: butyrate kinase, partial [Clostridiales bacterium]
VTVDEMIDLTRITGLKEIKRRGQGHNLNMRAAALRYCREQAVDYNAVNIVVAHLGGGITLSLHQQGRIIDMV